MTRLSNARQMLFMFTACAALAVGQTAALAKEARTLCPSPTTTLSKESRALCSSPTITLAGDICCEECQRGGANYGKACCRCR
jgi:hypothetical protein